MPKRLTSVTKWLLENLSSTRTISVEELEAVSAGQHSFGEILTGLNKLLIEKKIRTEGENPIRWRLHSV